MRFGGRLAEVEDLTAAISNPNALGLLDAEGKEAVKHLGATASLAKRLSVTVELEEHPKLFGDLDTALAALRESPAATDKIGGVTEVVKGSMSEAQLSQDPTEFHPQGDGGTAGIS